MARKKLGEMLVEAGAITDQSLRMALNEQRRWGGALGRILIDMKALSEPELVHALSQQLNLPTVDLDRIEIHPTVLELIPGELAEQHSIIPFAQPMKFLDVAMADPTNLGIIDELRIRTQLNIRPYLAGPKMIERALGTHYHRGFGRSRRPDTAVPIEGNDVIGTPPPTRASIASEGIRPFPRGKPPTGLDIPMVARPPSEPGGPPPLAMPATRDAEIDALQDRISKLEALVARDEAVLRKLLALLVDKGIATREEILERLR